jgi:hypothetical protein
MPSLKNMFVAPQAVFTSDQLGGAPMRTAEMTVTGLVCSTLCVRRARAALEGVAGVQRVVFQERPDRFVLEYDPQVVQPSSFRAAVESTVLFPRLRRCLEQAADLARRAMYE